MKATGFLSEMDRYLFGHGTHYEIYKKLGSHPVKIGRKKGIYFAVWAPNAKSVSLVGNFNNWDTSKHRMTPIPESGIFELFTNDVEIGEIYKYAICTADDRIIYKADPYANYAENRPGTASIVADLTSIRWNDEKWLERRKKPIRSMLRSPSMNFIPVPGKSTEMNTEAGILLTGSWQLNWFLISKRWATPM